MESFQNNFHRFDKYHNWIFIEKNMSARTLQSIVFKFTSIFCDNLDTSANLLAHIRLMSDNSVQISDLFAFGLSLVRKKILNSFLTCTYRKQ